MMQEEYGRTPAIFVSSTCYDLKHVRSEIRDFINNQLGYEAILSEFDSFPPEPEISTVENCVRVVKQRADIFCLLVGGRYGSIDNNGKSITNLEYIHAKAKGIPTYVFVEKAILSILPVWEKNHNGDFSGIVDNVKLFEFVSELRGKENIWVYEFENAQDIIKTLRMQLGYLFYDSLKIREIIRTSKLSLKVRQLNGEGLRLVLEKPIGWEYILLGKVLEQEINQYQDLKRDLIYGLSFGNIREICGPNEAAEYTLKKSNEMLRIIDNFNILFNKAIPEALGKPGDPGNPEQIIYVCEKLGYIYGELIRWGLEFKTLSVDEECKDIIDAMSRMCESPIRDFDNYLHDYKEKMRRLISTPEFFLGSETLNLTFTLNEPDTTDFFIALDKLNSKYGI